MAVGALIASAVIGVTAGAPTTLPTSAAALASATHSLPEYRLVRAGDTFTAIATQNHLAVDQLQALNPRQDPDVLLPGQRLSLRVPGPTAPSGAQRQPPASWIVHPGDTYSSISARTGVAVADIAQFNPKRDPNLLRPGMRLRLRLRP